MTFQDAILAVVDEFGKEILDNTNIINILGDFNAYDESKAFKVVLRLIISEGYLDQIRHARDWQKSSARIISKFVENTGIQENKADYILNSLAFVLNVTTVKGTYNPQQLLAPQIAQPVASNSTQTIAPKSVTTGTSNSKLNLTYEKLRSLSDDKKSKYKEKAENYLDSILEIQGDLKTEFGTDINIYSDFDTDNSFRYRIEINGKFKIKYTYGITFRFVVYDIRGKIVAQLSASVEKSKKLFQVVECGWCFHKDFKTLSNVQKIVMYWDIS